MTIAGITLRPRSSMIDLPTAIVIAPPSAKPKIQYAVVSVACSSEGR